MWWNGGSSVRCRGLHAELSTDSHQSFRSTCLLVFPIHMSTSLSDQPVHQSLGLHQFCGSTCPPAFQMHQPFRSTNLSDPSLFQIHLSTSLFRSTFPPVIRISLSTNLSDPPLFQIHLSTSLSDPPVHQSIRSTCPPVFRTQSVHQSFSSTSLLDPPVFRIHQSLGSTCPPVLRIHLSTSLQDSLVHQSFGLACLPVIHQSTIPSDPPIRQSFRCLLVRIILWPIHAGHSTKNRMFVTF